MLRSRFRKQQVTGSNPVVGFQKFVIRGYRLREKAPPRAPFPFPAVGEGGSKVKAMARGDLVDREAAARFLAGRYGAGVEAVAELGAGDWSRAFSFRLDGRDLVARFGRHVEDFLKDRKAMGFARPGLPVPAVLDVGESAPGLFYAISERRFGVFLEAIDFRRAVEAHYAAVGLGVENFEERLTCYELHIGLEHIAYATFTGRNDHLGAIAGRTAQILERRNR